MNFDDIIDSSKGQKEVKPFSKDEWKEKKMQERSEAYDLIDTTITDYLIKDVDNFKEYLNVQSRFDKYSVTNAILITAQMPNATQLKEYDKWKEAGNFVSKNAKGITILEPSEYTMADGNVGTTYNAKKVFDISQTNKQPNEKTSNYDENIILRAIIHKSPVDIKTVDELDSGNNVEWNKEDNILYIVKGLESPQVFHEITTELARVSFADMPKSEIEDLKCKYASYMVCKKLGVDVSDYHLELPGQFVSMDSKTIKAELTSVRSAMEDMNSRVGQYFEDLSNRNKNKEQER